MGEVNRPSEQAIALFTNVFGYEPDPEALNAGECWEAERIDAALRRAKVEGVASVRRIIQNRLIDLILSRSTCRLSFAIDEYDAQIEALESIMRQAGEPFSRRNENGINARAAQIEEGSK
jgi:hypothetical protein